MDKTLVIVESPAKAKTIGRFLGNKAKVLASMGHISDLPQHNIAIDIANDFAPTYELTVNGKKVIRNLTSVAKTSDKIYLATDPDREGEAIAWHLKNQLSNSTKAPFYRISFHEITKTAIQNAFNAAGDIDIDMVNAQQARRVLDRIVGYQVSPLLWQNIQKGTSAGRVQTVALRLIVEREREIQNFQAEEYWNLDAIFKSSKCQGQLKMRLSKINGEKALVTNQTEAETLANALRAADSRHHVSKVTSTPRQQHAAPPFITSTLQQAAGSNLKFGTSLTMKIAQELYEGVDIGGNGETGLITYMRTDSVNISKEAQAATRQYILAHYGKEFIPATPNVYKSRNTAQEAHEAIRPTDVNRTPESLAPYLTPQQLKLYRLIWIRFVASQMASACQVDHAIEVESSGRSISATKWPIGKNSKKISACTFRASYRETTFAGHLAVYNMNDIEEQSNEENERKLPELPEGANCQLKELLTEQCFTNPPFRYSEAALVKALEQNGVGRPSTYATTVKTICDRQYVEKDKGSLAPTALGCSVCDFLVEKMPDLFNIGFTAGMESELDGIEEGKVNWIEMMHAFYNKFSAWMGKLLPQQDISLSQENAIAILALFDENFQFDAPTAIGNRTYDDKKLIASLTKQVHEDKKPLSLRQRSALLNLALKYSESRPSFKKIIKKAGFSELLQAQRANNDERKKQQIQHRSNTLEPGITSLLNLMQDIKWEQPVKRGQRAFDDNKFYTSICRCVAKGNGLSDRQLAVLKRLASKYKSQIKGYKALAAKLGIQDQPAIPVGSTATTTRQEAVTGAPQNIAATDDKQGTPANSSQATILIELAKQIKNWHTTGGNTGNRSFNEKSFFESLVRQYKQKGNLSEKQLAALSKLVAKYASDIPDYKERIGQLGTIAKPTPRQTGESCPQCGAPLVIRVSRGKTFTACSAFPKCRFTK